MCFSIYKLNNVKKLCIAARSVQQIINDGILPEAFGKNRNGEAHQAVVTFDALAKAEAIVAEEQKAISPFLRYRREILANSPAGEHLRDLVMNLTGGYSVCLFDLFTVADAANVRIALECIVSAANNPQNDRHLSNLAAEITDTMLPSHSEVVA